MKEVKQILIAIDRSAMAEEALKRAISIAKKKDARLIVMHVIESSFIESPFVQSIDKDKLKREITEQIDQLNKQANIEYILFVESGSASGTIIDMVQKSEVDLLVVGSHGKSDVESGHFGSTTLKIIQNTHIPVLIVKNRVKTIYQKMIAPTNLSDYSKESILFANTLFTKPSRKYLYAFETMSELSAITFHISSEQRRAANVEITVNAKTALAEFVKEVGDGQMELIDFAASINEDLLAYITDDKADLLVLGSKGVDNLNSFVFGSTASYLVQRSPIDVLVYVPLLLPPRQNT
jgi:nucleotide-binding universal stress UspA family protein